MSEKYRLNKYMNKENTINLPGAERDVSFYRLLLIGVISLLLSVISCSSDHQADKTPVKDSAESADFVSLKIKGVKISVGDSAETVHDRIGNGDFTSATNDPSSQGNIIIVHSYVSDDKTSIISFCKDGKAYYQVCRISLVKSPGTTGAGKQSGAQRDSQKKSRGMPKIITNDDLKQTNKVGSGMKQ
jgi:hypothetical protein